MRVKARPCDPLTTKTDINRMRNYLRKTGRYGARNAMLVTLGCNLGLRASDLCCLRVCDLDGEYLDIVEQKTEKRRIIAINARIRAAVEEYVHARNLVGSDYIFDSQKGGFIRPKEVHRIMKSAGRALGIKGNIGSHTLRKTMAYHILKNNKNDTEVLKTIMMMLNHSSERVTERYLKSSAEIDDVYLELNL